MTPTLVLGLGNPLMGDDGAGLAALARLGEGWRLVGAELVDGGTWGLNLLPLLESFEQIVLLDAVHAGTRPGTLMVLREDELPRYFAQKLSPHQIDLREVLALAELRGRFPATLRVIGVEPERIDLGAGLSPVVAAAIDGMAARAVDLLRQFGHDCEARRPRAVGQDVAPCMS